LPVLSYAHIGDAIGRANDNPPRVGRINAAAGRRDIMTVRYGTDGHAADQDWRPIRRVRARAPIVHGATLRDHLMIFGRPVR